MPKTLISLFLAASALGAATVLGQQPVTTATKGTLMLEKKTYPLTHAAAYEATIEDEPMIAVVFSGQVIAGEQVMAARDAEKQGGDGDFKRPFLKLVFKKGGELKYWSASAGGTSLGRHVSKATGEITLQGNRAVGKASQPLESEGMFPSSFDVQFDVPLLKAGESLAASAPKKTGPAANVKPTVTGTFKGNGKDAKLAFVSARWGEPFGGKPGIVLVFTEKDHAADKKADNGAMFGRFGSALIISLHEEGDIYGCQVVHTALKNQGFSSSGHIETNDFSYADGKVEGQLTTHGPAETFGQTWEVDLKFVAPLGEAPKELQPTESAKPATAKSDDDDEDDDQPAAKVSGAEFKARDLALTKDATDVEYKTVVEQIAFKSKRDVKTVATELAANLKAQGWMNDGSDMLQPTSSILKRKRGAAKLTIFVKPENGTSEVKMMTEGLAWDSP